MPLRSVTLLSFLAFTFRDLVLTNSQLLHRHYHRPRSNSVSTTESLGVVFVDISVLEYLTWKMAVGFFVEAVYRVSFASASEVSHCARDVEVE